MLLTTGSWHHLWWHHLHSEKLVKIYNIQWLFTIYDIPMDGNNAKNFNANYYSKSLELICLFKYLLLDAWEQYLANTCLCSQINKHYKIKYTRPGQHTRAFHQTGQCLVSSPSHDQSSILINHEWELVQKLCSWTI